jgi:hypothetical protein
MKSPSSDGPLSPSLLQSDTRLSLDSDRSNSPVHPNGVNGHGLLNGKQNEDDLPSDPVEKLQRELERTREEKEALAAQYRNLLAKLTTMRTTLGNKLKQDAVRIVYPCSPVHNPLMRAPGRAGPTGSAGAAADGSKRRS